MTPSLFSVPSALSEQGQPSSGPGPTAALCPESSSQPRIFVLIREKWGSWGVLVAPLPPLSFLLTPHLKVKVQARFSAHPWGFMSVELKGTKEWCVGPKPVLQGAVILHQRLAWRVSFCHPGSPWRWQRGQRQPRRRAAFSGATLPTYFCWWPRNPSLASVSHWPSPMPTIKQKQVGERGTNHDHDFLAFTCEENGNGL